MEEIKRFSLVKPGLQTPFHIDFDWWRQVDRDWHVYLQSYLSDSGQVEMESLGEDDLVDLVDPETGEIHQVDGLQHLLITRFSNRDDFIAETTSLVEAIFRIFLANGNTPMTAEELADRLHRPPRTILQTLSGPRVYKGLRPCPEG